MTNYISTTINKHLKLYKLGVFILLLSINFKLLFDVILLKNVLFLNIIVYLLIVLLIDYRKITSPFFLVIFSILVSFFNKEALTCTYLFLVIYILKDYDLKYIATSNIIIFSIVLLITWYALEKGIIKETVDYYIDLGRIRYRKDFGFGNCNQLAVFIFSFVSSLWILFWRNHKLLFISIFLLLAIITVNYTDSRTLQLSSLFLFILLIIRVIRLDHNLLYKSFVFIYPILLLIYTFIFPFIDSEGIINALTSGRMAYYKTFLGNIGLKDILIGSSMVHADTIDSSYIHLIFDGGIFVFIVFFSMYYYTILKYYHSIFFYLPLILAILTYGIFESFFVNCANTGNILIWLILYQNLYNSRCTNHIKTHENNILH